MTPAYRQAYAEAIFNGLPGETLDQFVARRTAEFAAAVGPDYDAPGRGNPDLQRQWPAMGSTS